MQDRNPGPTNSELTPAERQALLFHHLKRFKATEVALKAARTAHQNVCKVAKSELGDHAVDDIKDAIKLEAPGGEAELRGEVERKLSVAQAMNAPMGFQFNFSEDMRPATDRAFADGRKAAIEGLACTPPHDPSVPQHDSWIEGWHAGQAVLQSDFRDKLKANLAARDDDADEAADDGQTDIEDAIKGSAAAIDTSDAPFLPGADEPRMVTDPDLPEAPRPPA